MMYISIGYLQCTSAKKQFHVGWEGVSTSVPQPTLRRLSLYLKSFHVGWATDVETCFPLRGNVIPRRGMLHLFLFFFVFLSFSRRLLYSTEVKWLGFHCGVLSFPVVECCIYFYFFLFFLVFHDGYCLQPKWNGGFHDGSVMQPKWNGGFFFFRFCYL
jgi:hypothetical protein